MDSLLGNSLWDSIEDVILVTTLPKSKSSKIKVHIYRETISYIVSVKYILLSFWNDNTKHQGFVFISFGLEQTTTIFPKEFISILFIQ